MTSDGAGAATPGGAAGAGGDSPVERVAVNRVALVQVQAWMGHKHITTTMRYVHYKSLEAEADMLAGAFEVNSAQDAEQLLLDVGDDEA